MTVDDGDVVFGGDCGENSGDDDDCVGGFVVVVVVIVIWSEIK